MEEGHDVEFEAGGKGGRVAETRQRPCPEFDQVEGGPCVLGDQRRRDGEGNQFFASEL